MKLSRFIVISHHSSTLNLVPVIAVIPDVMVHLLLSGYLLGLEQAMLGIQESRIMDQVCPQVGYVVYWGFIYAEMYKRMMIKQNHVMIFKMGRRDGDIAAGKAIHN